MTWERALEADARRAAKNSVLIRAALRQSIDFEAAFRGYQATTPDTSLSLPQQRVRARAWAIINVRVNLEAFKQIIYKLWAEAYVLGDAAADEALQEAREAQKAEAKGLIDWSKWEPGDKASALILKPPRAFQRLLESQGITWKGFSDTTLTDLGNAIGEAIELGLDAKKASKLIMNHVASPSRALTIAITEQNRAISAATINRYSDAGIQQMEWLTFDPCKICAQNENVVVNINAPFPSGDTQPPAHPNCRCALAPVIPGFDDNPVILNNQPIESAPTTGVITNANVLPINGKTSAERNLEIDKQIEQLKSTLGTNISDDRLLDAVRARGQQGEIDNTDIYWPLKKQFENMGYSAEDAKLQTQGFLMRIEYYLDNKRVEASVLKQLQDWDAPTAARYRERANIVKDRITNAMQNGKIAISVDRVAFKKIFEDERFKSQFESKTSGGLLAPDIRKMREKTTFDIDVNTPNKERPIYGYITDNEKNIRVGMGKDTEEWMDSILTVWNSNTYQYGNYKIILKDSVKNRATATIGDSLGKGLLGENVLERRPDWSNMGFYRSGAPTGNVGLPDFSYLETQIRGGVTIDDIDTIMLQMKPDDLGFQEVVQIIKASGRNIKVIPIKVGK